MAITAEKQTFLANTLKNPTEGLPQRFTAMFILRTIGDSFACENLVETLTKISYNQSELLEHELAYILGQILGIKDYEINNPEKINQVRNHSSFEFVRANLEAVLSDFNRDSVVRHEAAEALGAMLSTDSLNLLQRFRDDIDQPPEVRETCHISVKRIEWYLDNKNFNGEFYNTNPFHSVDPTPPINFIKGQNMFNSTVEMLYDCANQLKNPNTDIFYRYRCAFTIRNEICSSNIRDKNLMETCVHSVLSALHCPTSALLRHEMGYVLGQILTYEPLQKNDPDLVNVILASLELSVRNEEEHGMVRHESAMAFGEIDNETSRRLLFEFSQHTESSCILRESCVVALNMVEDSSAWLEQQFTIG